MKFIQKYEERIWKYNSEFYTNFDRKRYWSKERNNNNWLNNQQTCCRTIAIQNNCDRRILNPAEIIQHSYILFN